MTARRILVYTRNWFHKISYYSAQEKQDIWITEESLKIYLTNYLLQGEAVVTGRYSKCPEVRIY